MHKSTIMELFGEIEVDTWRDIENEDGAIETWLRASLCDPTGTIPTTRFLQTFKEQ